MVNQNIATIAAQLIYPQYFSGGSRTHFCSVADRIPYAGIWRIARRRIRNGNLSLHGGRKLQLPGRVDILAHNQFLAGMDIIGRFQSIPLDEIRNPYTVNSCNAGEIISRTHDVDSVAENRCGKNRVEENRKQKIAHGLVSALATPKLNVQKKFFSRVSDFLECQLEEIMIKKTTWILITLSFLGFASCSQDKSPWIWEINGKETTLNDFEAAYEGYLTLVREQLQTMAGRQISTEELKDMIRHPEKAGNEQQAAFFANLRKDVFANEYQMMQILNAEAEKKGFLKKEGVEAKLGYLRAYYLSNMYLMEKLSETKIEISEAEAIAAWEKVRNSNPRYKAVPLDQGVEMIRQQLYQQKLMNERGTLLSTIRDPYKIENNSAFDFRKYLADDQKQEKKSSASSDASSSESK